LVLCAVMTAIWWRWSHRGGRVGWADEARARELLACTDIDDVDEFLESHSDAGEGEVLSLESVTEEVIEVESGGRGEDGRPVRLRRIRRRRRSGFVAYWVNWGKAQFPTAWRGSSAADRVCITTALTRQMRSQSVRDADIARVKDEIVLGILTPSAAEVRVARMEATWAVQQRQEATRGLVNMRGGVGLVLQRNH